MPSTRRWLLPFATTRRAYLLLLVRFGWGLKMLFEIFGTFQIPFDLQGDSDGDSQTQVNSAQMHLRSDDRHINSNDIVDKRASSSLPNCSANKVFRRFGTHTLSLTAALDLKNQQDTTHTRAGVGRLFLIVDRHLLINNNIPLVLLIL